MSDDEGNIGIPFAIPDLWGLSKLHALEGDQDGSLFSQIKLDGLQILFCIKRHLLMNLQILTRSFPM